MRRCTVGEGTPSSSEDAGRPSKRKRIALACVVCRERKTRCDGRKPVCSPCTRRGEDPQNCVYAVLASSAKHLGEQEYIASLQRQVQDLQQTVAKYENQIRDENRENGVEILEAGVDRQTAMQTRADSVDAGPERRQHDDWQRRRSVDIDADEASPVGAMGVTTSMEEPCSHSSNGEFYGKSSVLSLLQDASEPRVRRRMSSIAARRQQAGYPLCSLSDSTNRTSSSWSDGRKTSMLEACYALPPREVADKLFDQFFSNVHIFYPWTHSPSVREAYNLLWSGDRGYTSAASRGLDIGLGGSRSERYVFFCALNAIFALGCEFSNLPRDEKESASKVFNERMKTLLCIELFDRDSISHVQALLLVGHSLLCSQYPSRCWNLVGLACRMAIGLGLQSERPSEPLSHVETEIRRRVWYGCVQMDMTVSMTLGRPPSVRVFNDVPLPSAVDDEYLSLNEIKGHQPENKPSQTAFSVENIKLAELLGMILDQIYHPAHHPASKDKDFRECESKQEPPGHEDFNTIASLNFLLDDLTNDLPLRLQSVSHSNVAEGGIGSILKRQSNVLHARLLHLKILLYRPSFSAYCASVRSLAQPSRHGSPGSSERDVSSLEGSQFLTSLRMPCAVACVKTTCELVNSIDKARMANATGAWWYSLFYLITCGVILIMAEHIEPLRPHLSHCDLHGAWETCLRVLNQMSQSHCRVSEYLQTLINLQERANASIRSETRLHGAFHGGRTKSQGVELDAITPAVEVNTGLPRPDLAQLKARIHDKGLLSGKMSGQSANTGETTGHTQHPAQCFSGNHAYEAGIAPLLGNWESDFENAMFPTDVFDTLDSGFPFSG